MSFAVHSSPNTSSAALSFAAANEVEASQDAELSQSKQLDAKIWESAQAFEATFIAQMLTFSGLGDALTLGGGESASPFASFYIDSFSEKITQSGGFGLAEHIYSQLLEKSGQASQEDQNVDYGTL